MIKSIVEKTKQLYFQFIKLPISRGPPRGDVAAYKKADPVVATPRSVNLLRSWLGAAA
jgi:hypothetical protein